MSSKQRSIRKKILSFDEEEEEGSGAVPPASVKAAQAQREKERKRADAKPKLSFDEDLGAGDGSLASKKKESRPSRPSLRAPLPAKAAEPPAPAAPSTQVSAAGEYTADKIRELQKNALRVPSAKPAEQRTGSGGGPLVGGSFKLSGSFKPAGAPKDSRFEYNVQAAAVLPRPEQAQQQQQRPQRPASGAALAGAAGSDMPLPPPPPPPAAAERAGSAGAAAAGGAAAAAPAPLEEEEEEEEDLDIPDEKMIQWAKAKRERLRAAHLAPDYIPTASMPGLTRLRDKKAQEEKVEAGSGSDDEEEEHMRLQFMGGVPGRRDKPLLPPGPPRQPGGGAGAGAEEEEDEEANWAQEQIRKGMGGLMRGEAGAAGAGGRGAGAEGPGGAEEGPGFDLAGPAAGWGAAGHGGPGVGGSQVAKINAAAEGVLRALQQGLQRLQTSHKLAERNLQRTTQNLQGAIEALGRLEGDLQGSSDKYGYLQKLRAYIQDLCYMLQDKSPLVEELEDHLLQLYEERAKAFQERRRLDDEESRQPAEAAVQAALALLSRGGTAAAAGAAAATAAVAAEQRQLGGDLPEELDEFGRDMNAERRQEAAQRAKRRQARLEAAEQQLRRRQGPGAGAGEGAELRLGEATSEESEGEASHFRLRQGEIQEAAGAVFQDAADEFGSIPAIKRQLEEWKARYPGAYRDAYMAISAPALFAPFVRLELLRWRPLEGGGAAGVAGFDAHQWYQQLFDYGMGPDPSAADPDDPDANLVPQLVQKLVLPLARHLLEAVWDPFSRRQSRAAAAMVADLLVYIPAEDESLQGLLRLVQSRLEGAVEATSLPAWPPSALAASPRAEAFLCHRFGRALRLLQAVCAFEGSLARGVLQELALQRLLSQHMLPFVRVAASDVAKAADRIHRTAAALPAEWFRGGPLRGCEGLMDLCNTLARSLEAQAGDVAARAANAASAKQLYESMLRLGGEVARANRLAKAYGVL